MGKKVKKLKSKAFTRIDEKKLKQNVENETTPLCQPVDLSTEPISEEICSSQLLQRLTVAAEKSTQRSSKAKYSASQLLEKAENCMDSFDYELASKFCQRAVDLEADNVPALEMLGFLRLQDKNLDSARKCFGRAIELEPERGHSKYMYMAQVSTGLEAIDLYLKGIEVMKKSLHLSSQSQPAESAAAASAEPINSAKTDVTPQDISRAHCAIAEIFLTDACFEDNAEAKCRENIDRALEADATNAEAYQLLASFWLCKEDKQLAADAIEKGLALWLPQVRESHNAECVSVVDPVQVSSISYSIRISYAKMLIELENYEVAEELLGFLFQEDNEVVDVWYLLGWMNYLRGEDFFGNSRYYLTKGHQLAVKIKCEDEQMMNHMTELIAEIGQATESDLEEEGEDVRSCSEGEDDSSRQQEESMDH